MLRVFRAKHADFRFESPGSLRNKIRTAWKEWGVGRVSLVRITSFQKRALGLVNTFQKSSGKKSLYLFPFLFLTFFSHHLYVIHTYEPSVFHLISKKLKKNASPKSMFPLSPRGGGDGVLGTDVIDAIIKTITYFLLLLRIYFIRQKK